MPAGLVDAPSLRTRSPPLDDRAYVDVESGYSNIEGEVVNAHDRDVDAALINPAGHLRTTGPLPTAIGQVRFPVIEVHLSKSPAASPRPRCQCPAVL